MWQLNLLSSWTFLSLWLLPNPDGILCVNSPVADCGGLVEWWVSSYVKLYGIALLVKREESRPSFFFFFEVCIW